MKIRRPLFDFSSPDILWGVGVYFVVILLLHFGAGLGWWRSWGLGFATQMIFYLEYLWAKHDLSALLREEEDDG